MKKSLMRELMKMVAGADLRLALNGGQLPHELGLTQRTSACAFTIT
jgi:hypothetical protein